MQTAKKRDNALNSSLQSRTYQVQDRQGQTFEVSLAVAPGQYPVVLSADLAELDLAEFNRLANQLVQEFSLDPARWLWITFREEAAHSSNPDESATQYLLLDFYLYSPTDPDSQVPWQVWWDGSYRDLDSRLVLAVLERLGALSPET